MADLRAEIDRLDRALITMLASRALYIDRAIELKPDEGLPARIPVLRQRRGDQGASEGQGQGLDPVLVESLWRRLIGWSIDREEQVIGSW